MLSGELSYLSIREAASLIARREVSPLELTDACIERAAALDSRLHAYISQNFESARSEARTATEEIAGGHLRGPLHGIPFAIKDLYDSAGMPTTAGSRLHNEARADSDAYAVALLKQAGVTMLGKLNLHEWAMGATNVNHFYPTPTNPWDPERVTGGSSGGSALALAAGLCFGSLGSDTRGSIRIPAALCGVTGLKPTYGRVSLRGVVPLIWSLDHAGPMARDAADCALILNAIAGYDEDDPLSVDAPVPDYAAGLESLPPGRLPLSGIRIGWPRNFFFDEAVVEREILTAVREARRTLEELGAEVRDVDFPDPEYHLDNFAFQAESAAYHEQRLRDHPEELSDVPRERIATSLEISGTDYARARLRQEEFKQRVRVLFREVDLLLTPTVAVSALRIDEVPPAGPGRILLRNTSPFNTLQIPAISLPCGFSGAGLPMAMQLAGRWWEEGLVLRAAHAYQQVTDWHKRRPALG